MKKNEKIYGIHSVTEFIKISPDRIINIWMQESIKSQFKTVIHEAAKNNDLSVQATKKDRLDKIIGNKNHQGIVIEVKRSNEENSNNLENILNDHKDGKPIYLILDSIQDPHNLGACIRTSVAAGVSAIIIPKDRAVQVNETVKKVACGAAESIPIITVVNLVRTLKKMKEAGIWIIGTASDAKKSVYNLDLKIPIAIVIGGESMGIRSQVRKECDFIGSLPIKKKIESLNASVAAGIVLYEAVRQREYR